MLAIIYIMLNLSEVEMASEKFIEIKGAREHNLKNVDINIPKDK